ncbi:hypothetical protein [Kitasatospora sp. NPDC057015]|uniref:hypothetical protein n=1 Tax=Kitasatospora sp. NPDC057015 TaxID=3346001 RepID=UPI003630F927
MRAPMPEPLSVHRVLGGVPFAEVGEPLVTVRCEARGEIAVGGHLGDLFWSGRQVGGWDGHRVGVYGLPELDCRQVVVTRWPVNSVDFHPSLPLLAVGTGAYDGGYQFEGELLLVDLTDGSVVSALDHRREVRRVHWRADGRALELVVAPPDEDATEDPFTHGFAAVLEREDWSRVAPGSVTYRELGGPRARAGHDPDGAERNPTQEAARAELAALCAARGRRWSPRRQVWAVEATADGRVLAALEGVKLESRLPSGEAEWSVPDPDGGHQLYLCPGEESAWVNVSRPPRWKGSAWEDRPSTVERLSLADGSTLDTAEVPFPAFLTADLDGRIALRDTRHDRPKSPVLLLTPGDREPAAAVVGGYDSSNQYFPVRHSPELLFLQGRKKKYWKDKWVVSVVPAADGGEPEVRRLFPLGWDTDRGGHLTGGPAVRLTAGAGPAGALVHAGELHHPHGRRPGYAFVVRRGFPDGAAQWVFTADHTVTALDTDGATVFAALTSGEVVALDAADGTPHWRTRLTVDGAPTVPLSLALAGAGRLLVGTVDGRILVCGFSAG